ncbi:MAG: anti-sigma F factor [Firmicutes bacterium]|nr:anti-sigma F factor [Bacillota bacterium]
MSTKSKIEKPIIAGCINKMKLELPAHSLNESFARSTVAAFASSINPTLDEINDIKTAVSEAVTNCVVHAYNNTKPLSQSIEIIKIECELYETHINISISDTGRGIKDIENAMQPFVTTRADEERSGMGFTVMQSFMDSLNVQSREGSGTTITMQKFFTKETSNKVKQA